LHVPVIDHEGGKYLLLGLSAYREANYATRCPPSHRREEVTQLPANSKSLTCFLSAAFRSSPAAGLESTVWSPFLSSIGAPAFQPTSPCSRKARYPDGVMRAHWLPQVAASRRAWNRRLCDHVALALPPGTHICL